MSVTSSLQMYQAVATQTAVDMANPHRLVQMLLEGALQSIARAKGHLTHGEVAAKGEQISRSLGILEGLRVSLDRQAGGALADNLDALYDYTERCLLKANIQNRQELLDEAAGLLKQIKSAWDAIAPTQAEGKNNE